MPRNPNPETPTTAYSHVTLGFRVFGAHAQIVRAAAAQKRQTVAAYCRGVILEWASAELGLPTPDMAPYEYTDVIAEAAKKHGVTPRAYTLRVAKEIAARELGIPMPTVAKVDRSLAERASRAA